MEQSLFQEQNQDGLRRGKVLLTAPINALTVSQPYASLIADGAKWVENRVWWTRYRGPLAIHAGKGTQYLSVRQLRDGGYPTGAVVAVVELVACIRYQPVRLRLDGSRVLDRLGISVEEFLEHEHAEGPYCWILRRVRKLVMPYPCRGCQGLDVGPQRLAARRHIRPRREVTVMNDKPKPYGHSAMAVCNRRAGSRLAKGSKIVADNGATVLVEIPVHCKGPIKRLERQCRLMAGFQRMESVDSYTEEQWVRVYGRGSERTRSF